MCDFWPAREGGVQSHAALTGEAGFSAFQARNRRAVEEPRGSRRDRFARLAGRGREETTPVVVQLGVAGIVAVLVAVILAISLVLWAVMR